MEYPEDIITEGSRDLLAQGIRVLQGNRFAPTEDEHLKKLISYMELNNEMMVADMGCGFGAVSLAMNSILPYACFYLINQNEFQLEHCPDLPQFIPLLDDMAETRIPASSIDFVMFNYSLCHVDHEKALAEAARIARPQARLFVYDYARTAGDNELAETYLFSRFMADQEFRSLCEWVGWDDAETIYPDGDDTLFRTAMNNDFLYDAIFEDLEPVIWRAHI